LTIVLESSGGQTAGSRRRNSDYNETLELLLQRLGRAGLSVTDILVDSQKTQRLGLPPDQRRLRVGDRGYPILLSTIPDLRELRVQICSAQVRIAQEPDAKGGNATKRVRLFLGGPLAVDAETLGRYLAGDIDFPEALPTDNQPAGQVESRQPEEPGNAGSGGPGSPSRVEDDWHGHIQDARERTAIERCAVQAAIRHYDAAGYQCEIRGKPYDLLCRNGAEERHVEVKGTKGEGEVVELTINEVTHARAGAMPTDLFIWGKIQVAEVDGEWRATGGELVCHLHDWVPEADHLEPTRFAYRVPPQEGGSAVPSSAKVVPPVAASDQR
jgi:hypothetical protein